MKPQLLKVSAGPASSFSVRRDLVPYINNRWHYHTEVELIHFKEGNGTQFIGDNIKPFRSGDVLLVGSDIPHYWSFHDNYFEDKCLSSPDVRVAHFCENFWGAQFLDLPENQSIKLVLERAKRGLQVNGKTREIIADLLEKMLTAQGTKKILLLMDALSTIANSDEITLLSSMGFRQNLKEEQNDRINCVYQYSLANYKRKIQMQEIAGVANMSPNSFCRYFKSRTRKTYSNFLIEIRVGIACKLLLEDRLSIKQICFESGFQNFASFHKYFKMITLKTPLTYQREYISNNN
jgi:AraC-like DNA-binding protein